MGQVITKHPKLIAHLAKVILREARAGDVHLATLVGDCLLPEQKPLVAAAIRKHRKKTRERFT